MYDLERQEKILQILKEDKSVSVNKLSSTLFVSHSTIRRDLSRMEQKGLAVRTFGGVILAPSQSNKEISFELRENSNLSEKRSLCQKASQLIKDNTTIFLDSSTTLLPLVPYLNNFSRLVIITNGLFIANEIINNTKHQVILPGGLIQPNTNSMLGSLTLKSLEGFHCETCLISSSAFDLDFGISETSLDQGDVKRTMIKNSDQVIALIDASKLGKKSLYKTCGIDDIDVLITDGQLDDDYLVVLKKNNVTLIKA